MCPSLNSSSYCVSCSTNTSYTNPFHSFYTGPVAISTTCKLIAPGVAINGLMSITKTDMYYEMDEDDAENKTIDTQVSHVTVLYKCSTSKGQCKKVLSGGECKKVLSGGECKTFYLGVNAIRFYLLLYSIMLILKLYNYCFKKVVQVKVTCTL